MKSPILLLALTLLFLSSCTTSYKTGQTPDDVYFSPARVEESYVETERKEEKYRMDDEYYDDRYLRMKVRNRNRWNDLYPWYSYEKYGNGYNYVYGTYNNPYNSWNYYYNPYCSHNYINTKNVAYSRPRNFNLGTFGTSSSGSISIGKYPGGTTSRPYTSPRNSSGRNDSERGNVLRDIFKSGNSSNSSDTKSTNSSSNSNSSSPKSSSSSSGSSAPVRRF